MKKTFAEDATDTRNLQMSRDSLKTLLHPFEAEAVAAPQGERVIFLGAEPGFRPPANLSADIVAIQGLRPLYRALQRDGRVVHPIPEGSDFDGALVLCGRHRGENEVRIAEALDRTKADGLIVVAGSKDDGIASLRKRVAGLVAVEHHLSKYHGVAFWFHRAASSDEVASMLRAANPPALIEGRFRTAPGMFSWDRVDRGSALLVEHLPTELSGPVADFGAGWGYLSAHVLDRCPAVTLLHLYEADFASLEAAKTNLADRGNASVAFHWHDLITERVEKRFDAIVMNPPFHTGRAAEPSLGQKMIEVAAAALTPRGRLFLVANTGLPYERTLAAKFASQKEIARRDGFKVIEAAR